MMLVSGYEYEVGSVMMLCDDGPSLPSPRAHLPVVGGVVSPSLRSSSHIAAHYDAGPSQTILLRVLMTSVSRRLLLLN